MNIPILMYHQVDAPPPRSTPLRGLVVSPSAFARQMWVLKLLGYKGLSMRDLEPYLEGKIQGRVAGITFDDGYQNNVKNALPVLKQIGFTATCYAVSQMIGRLNNWDLDIGVPQKPLMTANDWHVWLDNGMEIGSHTRSHADLTKLNSVEAFHQIADSKHELEDSLNCEVRHFCYPYGRYDETHRHMTQQAGYVTATTTRRGRVQPNDDSYALRRVLVAQSTALIQFTLKIATSYEDQRG